MKGFLYILKSDTGRFYIGSTSDLDRRFKQHVAGQTHTTKRMNNLELVFSEEFATLAQAREVERKIKAWKRKDFIEKIISDGFIRK